MSNKAAVIKEKGAPILIEQRDIPTPEASQVLVRTHAIATNPVDWKMQSRGYLVDSWPTILGSDVAGTVEEVGSGVTLFQKGDRVAGFADVILTKNLDHAAFQEYSILEDCALTKLPASTTFEEGSILPMAVATSAVGIFLALDLPRPPAKQQGGFLVWGAPSSVGTAVVQIVRSLGYTVYAVCSERHHAYIKQLGAHECYDYNSSSVIKDITKSLKASNQQIVLAYDAISENGSPQMCAEVLEFFGGGRLCLTLPWPSDVKKPAGLEIVSTLAARIVGDSKDFGKWLFAEWLSKSLADKTYVPSPAIERIDGGIDAIQKALDIHKQGLSGKKLVVPL